MLFFCSDNCEGHTCEADQTCRGLEVGYKCECKDPNAYLSNGTCTVAGSVVEVWFGSYISYIDFGPFVKWLPNVDIFLLICRGIIHQGK